MKIAVLYARVSSAKQQLNETIASQIAAIEEYARQNDFQISPQHIYRDDGFSGARLDRPALDRLRDAVAQGEVEAVLILSPDLLARQFAYQYIVVEGFERAGCAVVFTSHNFGSSPADRMLQEMTGVFAEYERTRITERGRRGRLHHTRQGQIWMKEGPYGWLVFLYVPDVDALYEEITGRGIKAQSPPEDFEGRIRDFQVIDPDGNKLDFCTRLNS